MQRIEAIRIVARHCGDALIVCNLGYPSRELYAVADSDANFYMLGSMGLSSSIGLGLALAQRSRKVIALDGDGSVLMNLGTLSTLACHGPDNFLLIILDNGVYGSTGMQRTPIHEGADLSDMAKAAGIGNVGIASNEEELVEALGLISHGVLLVRVEPGNSDVPIIDLTPSQIIERFLLRASRQERPA